MNKNNKRFKRSASVAFNRCAFIFLFSFTAGLGFLITADRSPDLLAVPASQKISPATQGVGVATLLSKW